MNEYKTFTNLLKTGWNNATSIIRCQMHGQDNIRELNNLIGVYLVKQNNWVAWNMDIEWNYNNSHKYNRALYKKNMNKSIHKMWKNILKKLLWKNIIKYIWHRSIKQTKTFNRTHKQAKSTQTQIATFEATTLN